MDLPPGVSGVIQDGDNLIEVASPPYLVCDFCSNRADDQSVVYQAEGFSILGLSAQGREESVLNNPAGTWLACPSCALFIELGRPPVMIMTGPQAVLFQKHLDAVAVLHHGFLVQRIPGPPVPLKLLLEQAPCLT